MPENWVACTFFAILALLKWIKILFSVYMLLFQKSIRNANSFFWRVITLLQTHPFESLFSLPLFLFFGWYLLALAGLFYPIFTLALLLIIGGSAAFLINKRPAFCNLQNGFLLTFLIFLALIATTTHPIELVAEGRDQGTFANSALLLAQQHSFLFSLPEAKPFFEVYGPGKALHFPGLAYTQNGQLVPEFPLGYIVWLAGFVSIFGLMGFTLANIIAYLGSGLLFYTLVKRVAPIPWSFVATLVTMGGFLPLWFLSFTLTENLCLFFFLLTAEAILRFRINQDRVTLLLALASVFALALTRIEGWAILVITFLLLTYKKPKREWLKTYLFHNRNIGLLWLFLAAVLTGSTFWLNHPYYKAILKALWKNTEGGLSISTLGTETLPLYSVLGAYGLLLPFILGLVAILFLAKTRRYYLLSLFFLCLPTLPYLFLPHITLDAPWMLRRFLFTLYPTLLIATFWATALLITHYRVRKPEWVWVFLFVIILGGQVPALQRFIQTDYQHTLIPQVEALARRFTEKDLLLIDKDVTGDNFMMPARALSILFDRPSVYFFNQEDLAKIRTDNFERVILITPPDKLPSYIGDADPTTHLLGEFMFENDHSFRTLDLRGNILPQRQTLQTSALIIQLY